MYLSTIILYQIIYDLKNEILNISILNKIFNKMSETKRSLKEEFISSGDIIVILDLIQQHNYTNEEVSEVINIYEPYTDNQIPVNWIFINLYN